MLPIFFLTVQYKMPGKKYFKRKRQVRKRGVRTARKSTTLVNRSVLSPIPARYLTKMKYAESFTLTGTGLRTQVMNLNSLFDPNRSGIGHQPYGFDQLCGPAGSALYNRYRVYKVDYVVFVTNDTYNIHYAVLNSNDTPPIGNVSEARENPRCSYGCMNPGGTLKPIKGSITLPSLLGRTKGQYMANPDYAAVYNATPNELALMNIFAQGMNDDVGVSMTHTVNVLLTYHVEFFDPHVLDQS